jgi:superfamily II DNA or RNA helicase
MKNPTIILSNMAYLTGLSQITRQKIRKFLTIDNPLFQQGLNLGLANWGVPRNITYYKEPENNNAGSITVPIGALNDILHIIKEDGEVSKSDIIDNRYENILSEYFDKVHFTPTLRDYQQDMVDACTTKTIGVLEAMTGAGKTIFALALILKMKQSTIFLVNTLELAQQAINSFVKFTNLNPDDIGFIGDGQFSVKPITIALHQTMARLSEKQFGLLNKSIGMVIADEVHIVAASTYYQTMVSLKAKYKWGISATPKRDDGLTKVIFLATGPKIHTVPKEKFTDILITPEYKPVETTYTFPLIQSQDYQEMIADLSIDKTRNALICDTAKEYSDKMLVFLCLRISQVEHLTNELGDEAVMLTSKMSKKERKARMEQLVSGKKRIVVSTYGLFSTGIDIPKLEVLFMCAPMRSEVKLRQSAGRLMRKAEGKTSAYIIDFVDRSVGLLAAQARKRANVLKKL